MKLKKALSIGILFFFCIPLVVVRSQANTTYPECTTTLIGDVAGQLSADVITSLESRRDELRNAGSTADEAAALYCLGLVNFQLGSYPDNQTPFLDARRWFERALLAYRNLSDRSGEARALHQFGRTYFAVRDFGNTLPQYQQALRTATAVNDTEIVTDIYFEFGFFYLARHNDGDLALARESFQVANTGYFQLQNEHGQADSAYQLAEVDFALWNLDDALDGFDTAARSYADLGNVLNHARSVHGIARILHHIGNLHDAEERYGEALALYMQAEDILGQGRVISALGDIYYQFDFDIAETALDEAIRLNRLAGDNLGRAFTLVYLGNVYLRAGDISDARSSYNSALEIANELGDISAQAAAYHGRGRANAALSAQGRQELREALNDFGAASGRYRDQLGDLYNVRRVFISEGLAWFAVDPTNVLQYETMFYEARNKGREVGDRRGEAESIIVLARTLRQRLLYDDAFRVYTDAFVLAEVVGDPSLVGDINLALGEIDLLRSRIAEANDRFQTALFDFQDSDEPVKQAQALGYLGVVTQRLGSYREAVGYYRDAIDLLEGVPVTGERSNQAFVARTLAVANMYLGTVYNDLNLPNRAEEQLDLALRQLTATGDAFNQANSEVALADAAFARRTYSEAQNRYRRALRTAEQSGNSRAVALSRAGIASSRVASDTGTELENQNDFESALDLIRAISDADGEHRILLLMGNAALHQGDLDEAITLYGSARSVAQRAGDSRSAAYDTLLIAQVQYTDPRDRLGSTARMSFERALNEFSVLVNYDGQARAYRGMGDLALRRAQYNTAIENFNLMRVAYDSDGNTVGVSVALTRLGNVYRTQSRNDQALATYIEALDNLFTVDTFDEFYDDTARQLAEGEAQLAVGDLYRVLEDFGEADRALQQADALLRDPALFADVSYSLTLTAEGNLRRAQREFGQALELLTQAQSRASNAGDAYALGQALYATAQLYTFDGDATNQGEEDRTYSRALDIFRRQSINPALARNVLISIADAYVMREDYDNAEAYYLTARNEAREASDPVGEGYALLELGRLRAERRRTEEASADLTEAIRQFQLGDDPIGHGEALFRLAELDRLDLDFVGAIDRYQEALALYEAGDEPDLLRQADSLTRIGEVYQLRNQLALSLNYHFLAQEVLQNARDALTSQGADVVADGIDAKIRRNLGVVRTSLGQYDAALVEVEAALNLATSAQDNLEVAIVRHILGELYYLNEQHATAYDTFQQVEREYRELDYLDRLGVLFLNQGDTLYRLAARPVEVTQSDTPARGRTFDFDIDRMSEARIQYQRALDEARTNNDIILEARAQQALGMVYNRLGENDQASQRLVSALEKADEAGQLTLRAGILVELGLLAEERSSISDAVNYYEQAIALYEDVFVNIRLEPGQIAFASQNILPYHRLVALNIARGDDRSAFEYAERGRARALLYQMGSERLDFGAENSGVMREWQMRRQEISAIHQKIADNAAARLNTANELDRAVLDEESDALRDQLEALQTGMTDVQERVDAQSAVLAHVTQVNPRSLEEIQSSLMPDMTMLSYYLIPKSTVNEGAVYAFVVQNDIFRVETLDTTPERLTTQILVSARAERNYDTARDTFTVLYNELIGSVAETAGDDTLVIIPHGVLNNLPFAALTPNGDAYLSDQHELVFASSATFFSLLREERQPVLGRIDGSALVYGNPDTLGAVYPVAVTRDQLASLPAAEVEAQVIATRLQVEPIIQSAATETDFWHSARERRLIHIAAHGVFDPTNPLNSFLALAEDEENDGALQVREIYSLGLDETEPLVVLSACDTAVGGSNLSDDVQSLSRAFLISGARSVVASLWKVDDEATQALMTRFYANMVDSRMPIAEALSDAQAYVREQPQWAAPRYWAAFVIVGLPM